MSLLRRIARAALAAAFLPALARAQSGTLTFPSSLNNPVAGGYYVGPYGPSTYVPSVGQAQSLSVICVDFLNHVNFGQRINVDATKLTASALFGHTRHPDGQLTYEKAAFLGGLFSTTAQSGWGSIQYALWNLFTPAQAPDDANSPKYLTLADQAAANNFQAFDYLGTHYNAVDLANWYVLTDVAAEGHATGGAQEFIAYSQQPLTSVPEPGTLALAASGLAALGGGTVVRRRRAKRESQLD